MQNLDYSLFQFFNSLAVHKIIAALAIFFGVFGIYLLVVVVIDYWFLAKDRIKARSAVILAVISFILARGILTQLIRAVWARTRPFVGHQVIQLISPDTAASFPSGHTIGMFSVAAVIYFYNRKLGTWLLIL